jgi:hypothetical protein
MAKSAPVGDLMDGWEQRGRWEGTFRGLLTPGYHAKIIVLMATPSAVENLGHPSPS